MYIISSLSMDPTFGNLTLIKLHTYCIKEVFGNKKYTDNYVEFNEEVQGCISNVYKQYPYVV